MQDMEFDVFFDLYITDQCKLNFLFIYWSNEREITWISALVNVKVESTPTVTENLPLALLTSDWMWNKMFLLVRLNLTDFMRFEKKLYKVE